MSKQRSKKNGEETAESAVEELDDALEALPGGSSDEKVDNDDGNPLEQVDVSGTTSFESAGFAAEYEGREHAEEESQEDDEDDEDEDEDEEDEEHPITVYDVEAEDRAEEEARRRAAAEASGDVADDEVAPGGQPRELSELMAICEALIFVSEEPLPVKTIADVLKEDKGWIQVAVESLAKEFNERNGGLMLREVAGGWQIATRPEHHEHVRAYLKSKPSAKLSLAALETLAVIAYKQPVTVPEILEIRGVQSSSAIKTLLDKRLIVAKGRKETVGRPMMYGTSKDFLLQFGLKDLSELPNVEDFEDLTAGSEG
jgi:segregation and condensation protein B